MTTARVLSVAGLLIAWSACAEVAARQDASPADEGELKIQLSPAAAQKAFRESKLDFFRRKINGDAYADEAWDAMKPALRASLLGELAATKETELVRKRAIREIGLMKKEDDPELTALTGLLSVAVAEPNRELRQWARVALTARGDERTPRLLIKALKRKEEGFRDNAVAALKALAGPRTFEILIEHWKETWGPGPRGHIYVGAQQSYIADYDISGDSYDPQVKTFLTGTVLDVKSLRVEGDIYYITIRQIAPDNIKVGGDPEAWERWLEKNKNNLAKELDRRRNDAFSKLNIDED